MSIQETWPCHKKVDGSEYVAPNSMNLKWISYVSPINFQASLINYIQGGAPKIAKLVNITPISLWFMVNMKYTIPIVYKPTNITFGEYHLKNLQSPCPGVLRFKQLADSPAVFIPPSVQSFPLRGVTAGDVVAAILVQGFIVFLTKRRRCLSLLKHTDTINQYIYIYMCVCVYFYIYIYNTT